jgi:hypothetical protein
MRNIIAAATALALVTGLGFSASAQQSNDYRRAAERRNSDVAAGLVVGATITGANGSVRLYAPGYAYPAYGQAGYGDPRSDPRYAQGGYAYGRPQGQWVPISQRSEWLDQRINRGAQEGTLDRGDVRSLRRELAGLQTIEVRYSRGGMRPWQMADLDKRFDALASRIHYERTDGDNGPSARRQAQDANAYRYRNDR